MRKRPSLKEPFTFKIAPFPFIAREKERALLSTSCAWVVMAAPYTHACAWTAIELAQAAVYSHLLFLDSNPTLSLKSRERLDCARERKLH